MVRSPAVTAPAPHSQAAMNSPDERVPASVNTSTGRCGSMWPHGGSSFSRVRRKVPRPPAANTSKAEGTAAGDRATANRRA